MRAERALKRLNRNEEQWARALFREKAEMDYRSAILNARDEGIKIGEEKSRQNSLEAARKMKALGMSPEQIEDILGLSPEETEKP